MFFRLLLSQNKSDLLIIFLEVLYLIQFLKKSLEYILKAFVFYHKNFSVCIYSVHLQLRDNSMRVFTFYHKKIHCTYNFIYITILLPKNFKMLILSNWCFFIYVINIISTKIRQNFHSDHFGWNIDTFRLVSKDL